MGTQYLNTQFRLRRGTAEAWARNNPILAKGEPGWATDTKVLKIGDGITHWNELSAYGGAFTIDDTLDYTSINPVQNKVLAERFQQFDDRLDNTASMSLQALKTANAAGSTATGVQSVLQYQVYPRLEALENGEAGEQAVLYTEQTLTSEQKSQARKNIGAGEPVIVEDEIITDENGNPISENPLQSKVIGTIVADFVQEIDNLQKQVEKGRVVYINVDTDTKLASHSPQEIVSLLDEGKIPVLLYLNVPHFPGHCTAVSSVNECWFFGLETKGDLRVVKINAQKKIVVHGVYSLHLLPELEDWMWETEELLQELANGIGELSGTVEALSSDVEDLSEYVDSIAGNSLPEITTADEQKLLQVVDGKPVWGEDVTTSHFSSYIIEALPQDQNSQGVVLVSEDPSTTENGLLTETLTFYGAGHDEPVRLRHLAYGVQEDDAVTVGQVLEFAQNMRADWDVENSAQLGYIKNKPFGMVEQMVDVVREAEYNFYKPTDTTTDIVCFSVPGLDSNLSYNVWFNDIYLGTAKPGETIEIPNGQFGFNSGAMVIYGGNYPEGDYKVRIAGKQVVAKKLDSQWLNIQSNIYTAGADNEPASCRGVIAAIDNFGSAVGRLDSRLNNDIIPAIGPIPSEDDNGKLLQVVDGKPAWVEVNIGSINEALDATIALQEEVIALQRVLTGENITIASEELHNYAQSLIEGGQSE